MHIYATTKKPPEPTAIMNGLLYAKLRGNVFGEFEGALSFQEQGAFVNPDNSLRGHQNPQYDVIPPLHHLDRTSALAISLREAHRYTPKGSTGYTSEFRSLDYVSGVSSKLAHWFREYQTLYYAALKAESDLHKQAGVRVDVDMDVRYGEGIVEAFYAATGDFTGRTLGYQSSVPLSVQGIYDRVLTSMAPWLDIVDHEGWMMGENSAKEYIGIGSIPQTKQNVLCLSANAKDALFSFPWARILTVPRARDLVRDRFMERVNEALGVSELESAFITITEGDGVLMIPTVIAAAGWDAITDAIDSRVELSGRYSANTQSWLDQFYTTGDLAASLFAGDLDPYENGRLAVMLSAPEAEQFGEHSYLMGSVVNNGFSAIPGTGPLSSVNNLVQHTVGGVTGDIYANYITGTTTAIWENDGSDITPWTATDADTPVHSLDLGVADWLPNGILYCGSVGTATAVNWIDIMRTLSLSLPISTRVILDKSGRKKKSLPSGVPTVSVDALMARALAYGQRDGYIATSTKAFNSKRLNRDEQEGPAFFNTLEVSSAEATGLTEAHYGHVSPLPAAYLNGWDRLDANAGKFIIEPGGTTVHLDGPLPSSFCGEWDAGRLAVWTPSFLPDSAATADNTVERFVARSLMSYPAVWNRVGQELYPRFIPDSDLFQNHEYSALLLNANAKGTANSVWQLVTGAATVDGEQVTGYAGTTALESVHPVSGFTRGLASFLPPIVRGAANTGVSDYFPGGPSCHRSMVQHTVADPTPGVRLQVGGDEYTVIVSLYDPVGDPTEGTPCQTWFWDPTRAQIVGDSWTRWAGAYFDDVLPDPYLPFPVAQMTSSMPVSDLLAYEEISLRSTGLVGYHNGAVSANTNAGSEADYRCFALNNNLSQYQTDSYSPGVDAVFPMNSGSRWRGAISAPGVVELSTALAEGHSGINNASEFSTFVNPFLVHMPVTNGCSSVGMGHIKPPSLQTVHRSSSTFQLDGNFSIMALPTGSIMEAAVEANAGNNYLTAVGITPAGTPLGFMNVLEGQTLAPIAGGGAVQHGIAITGQGISFEGDVVTPGMLEPMKWFSSVFEPVETTVRNQLGDYWPITGVDDTTIQVARHIGSGLPAYNEDPAAREQASLLPSALIRLSNDWFQRGNGLINKHARMRRSSLINPWTRAAGANGIVDLMYMNDGILPMFNAMVDAFRMNGGKFQKGLESSMFLEVHQAN